MPLSRSRMTIERISLPVERPRRAKGGTAKDGRAICRLEGMGGGAAVVRRGKIRRPERLSFMRSTSIVG